MKNDVHKNILILSQPAHSGKTSSLETWIKGRDVAGILMPEVNGRRMLQDVRTGDLHMFEVDETYGGETIVIGRFLLAKKAFMLAREILERTLRYPPHWLLIDEVGKLEIEQGEGLEPLVLRVTEAYRKEPGRGNLLLVVRDSLLAAAIRKYNLENALVSYKELPA